MKFYWITPFVLSIIVSCTSSTEFENDLNVNDKTGTVTFNLAGNASTSNYTRDCEEELIQAETKVNKLYAVIFKSNEETTVYSTANPYVNSGFENDTFFKCENLTNLYGTDDLTIKLPAGNFNICFVANVNDIESKLKDFHGSLDEFKKITTSTPLNIENGLLMVSEFYGVKIIYGVESYLGTVYMKRALARIDIENRANDVTINRATLKYQKKDTYLFIQDDGSSTANNNDNYSEVGGTLTFDENNLSKLTFYTYEILNPFTPVSLILDYTFKGQNYSHTVKFMENDNNDNSLSFKRNYFYTITMNNTSEIRITVLCKDWDDNKEIRDITYDDLTESIMPDIYEGVEVGDFMLNDGTILKREDVEDYDNQEDIVGMVALLYDDCPELWAKDGSHGGFKHGLVFALKELGSFQWGPMGYYDQLDIKGLYNSTSGYFSYANFKDGYRDWLVMSGQEYNDDINGNNYHYKYDYTGWDGYEIWAAIKTKRYADKGLDKTTSNWYLPAPREFIEILRELCTSPSDVNNKGSYTGSNPDDAIFSNFSTSLKISGSVIRLPINYWWSMLPSSIVDNYKRNNYYWLSSEYDNIRAYIFWDYSNYLAFEGAYKYNKNLVRCILAF